MQHETESLTRGAPVEARIEEFRSAESPGEGDVEVTAVLHTVEEPIMGMPPDELIARSEFATALRPRAFPADAKTLLRVAANEHAPEWVSELLRRIDQVELYENVQRVWEAAGGHREQRTMPHDEVITPPTPQPAAPQPAAPQPTSPPRTGSATEPRGGATRPAPARKQAPRAEERQPDAVNEPRDLPSVDTDSAASEQDEGFVSAVAGFTRAGFKLAGAGTRVATAPLRFVRRAMPF